MSKHTEGPWKVQKGEKVIKHLVNENCLMVYHNSGVESYGYIAIINDGNGEAAKQANAHLIAAAPEMFEELVFAQGYINAVILGNGDPEALTVYERIVKVINKAKEV